MADVSIDGKAVRDIAMAIEILADDLSACEDVVLAAMCLALGRRVAERATSYQDAQNVATVIGAHMAFASAVAMSEKLNRGP